MRRPYLPSKPGHNANRGDLQMTTTPGRATLMDRYGLPPADIEALSLRRVAAAISEPDEWDMDERTVALRVIYAAGDVGLAPHIRFHRGPVQAGVEALRRGCPIVTDVRMVEVALDRTRSAALGNLIYCAIAAPSVAEAARLQNTARAAVAMRLAAPEVDGGIAVIGNAPTALLALLDLIDNGATRPALIIGMPVGFVAAAESKQELLSREIPAISILGSRGGSAVAAAAVNALLRLAAGRPAP